MKNKSMPAALVMNRDNRLHFDLSPKALEMWNPNLVYGAADSSAENTISILEVIGQDYWTGEGVTAKRIAGALRAIGDKDVTVLLNSPGGDLFEGSAIYSLFREHPGKVTVKILGVAASAASIIAMGADEIKISLSGFFMIHNAWVYAAGNRNDMRDIADYLEPFDLSMAGIYAARSGEAEKSIIKMMDAETWINANSAIEKGFADALLDSDAVKQGDSTASALFAARQIDVAMAKAGVPRSQRREWIQNLKAGTQDAASNGMRDATALDVTGELGQLSAGLLNILK